jgi:hypothetical protein
MRTTVELVRLIIVYYKMIYRLLSKRNTVLQSGKLLDREDSASMRNDLSVLLSINILVLTTVANYALKTYRLRKIRYLASLRIEAYSY